MAGAPLRIVLADDHAVVRAGVRRMESDPAMGRRALAAGAAGTAELLGLHTIRSGLLDREFEKCPQGRSALGRSAQWHGSTS